MTGYEVRSLSACVDLVQLAAYTAAVADRTQKVAQGMRPEDLDTINDAAYIQHVVDQDGFVTEGQALVPAGRASPRSADAPLGECEPLTRRP